MGLLGCGRAGISEAFDPRTPRDEALAICARLEDAECTLGALEAHGPVAEADCVLVPEGKWRQECVFIAAEQLAAAGELAAGMQACHRSFYARQCAFHLIRERARAVAELPPEQAQAGVEGLQAPRAPDALTLFWGEWFRSRAHDGTPVDPTQCDGLAAPAPCRIGAEKLWEEALIPAGLDSVCGRLRSGEAPLPGFAPDQAMLDRLRARCTSSSGYEP